MSSAPTTDSCKALARLRDEQRHILKLFDTYAFYQRGTSRNEVEVGPVATFIYILLRVHCELETMLLLALAGEVSFRATLIQIATRRSAMLDALECAEAMSSRDTAHVQVMDGLANSVRAWFDAEEHDLFALTQRSSLDQVTLDRQIAVRQEELLTAEKTGSRSYAG